MKKMRNLMVALCALFAIASLVSCSVSVYECEHAELEKHEYVAATCTEDGSIEFYECTKCHRYFNDSAATETIGPKDTIINALGHDMIHHEYQAAGCVTDGNKEYYECSECHKFFNDLGGYDEIEDISSKVIAATGHQHVNHVDAEEPDCFTSGNNEYYYCEDCDGCFADEECTEELDYWDDIYLAALEHDLVHVEYKASKCDEYGNEEYWYCSLCGTMFWDEDEEYEIEDPDYVVIGMVDHANLVLDAEDYQTATLEEPGYLHFVCEDCGNDVFVPTYAYKVNKELECTGDFQIDHRATYSFVDADGSGKYASNNKGVGSSGAYMDLKISADGFITFKVRVSSEATYDKFNAYYAPYEGSRVNFISNASGVVAEQSYTYEVSAGDVFTFSYTKDSSGNRNDDVAEVYDIIFYTTEEIYKVNVTLVDQNFDEIDVVEVYANAPFAVEDPERPGYFFDGWFVDPECSWEFEFQYGVAYDSYLFAKFTKGVNVTYANTGDSVVDAELVYPGQNATKPADKPVMNDNSKYFVGWFADAKGKNEFDFNAAITKDTVVYGIWRDPVVLTFDSNEGSEVTAISTDINVSITEPDAPTKAGYRFDGWYAAGATEAFDFASGIAADTTVFAKWVEVVTVTYKVNDAAEAIGTVVIDKGSKYTAVTPEGCELIIEGFFNDAAYENAFAAETVVNADKTIYVKVYNVAPEGVLSSFVNALDSAKKVYNWTFDVATHTFTSNNKGIGSSKATMTFTFAKQSFVSFDYFANGEGNYDYLYVEVNGTITTKYNGSGSTEYTKNGTFTATFNAGDVVKVIYMKDSSGNKGQDCAKISNLVINDGVPSVMINFDNDYDDTIDGSIEAQINSKISDYASNALFTPSVPADKRFGGFFYDKAFTQPVGDDDLLLADVTLYPYFASQVTITFVTEEGATNVDPINVWAKEAVTLPANPSKDHYVFRYWLTEDLEEFNPANGVEGATTLTAYFEAIPAGASKEEALEIDLATGYANNALATTEEYQVFYAKFTAAANDFVYIDFPTEKITIAGGTTSSKYYRRLSVVDADGNFAAKDISSFPAKVAIEAGKTYYATFNLASGSYKAWGSFGMSFATFAHDSAAEAATYTFGETATTAANTFHSSAETYVYAYEAATTGTFRFTHTGTGWSSVTIYNSAEMKSSIKSNNNAAGSTSVFDLAVEAGKTYYIAIGQNWSSSEYATKAVSIKIDEYPAGYSADNALAYTMGETVTTDFGGGATMYYTFTIAEAGTYLVEMSSSNSNTKNVDVFLSTNLNSSLCAISSSANTSKYIENLAAGTYVIRAKNSSTYYTTNFSVKVSAVGAGAYWTTAEALTLEASTAVNASANGYYYTFTTGDSELWYFFAPAAGSVEVFDSARKSVGVTALHLPASTTYYLVVKGSEATTVAVSTLVEYADGKSPSGAFTYSEENKALPLSPTGTYTFYFKFECTESGTYRFYSNNNGSVDTKGYVYSDAAFSKQLKYNDDGGKNSTDPGYNFVGYKYDFYFEQECEAGTTYYVKVTYSIYSGQAATSLDLVIAKVE